MSTFFQHDSSEAIKITNLVNHERKKALSPREWRHRLAGYGYGLKDTAEGMVVTKLPLGNALCMIPQAT